MSYRIEIEGSLEKSIRRIALAQVGLAGQKLAEGADGPAAIHDARKHLKRVRALLRLVRPAMRAGDFRRENARLREIGQMLAGARDLDVLAQTAAALAASTGSRTAAPLRRIAASAEALLQAAPGPADRRRALALLREAGAALAEVEIGEGGFELVERGLRDSYRACRRALAAAYASPSDDLFHEWRKATQHHWRHMALLARAWPEEMRVRVAAARELSAMLGHDHDLTMLEACVRAGNIAELTKRERGDIAQLCRSRKEDLRAAARPRGERLFAERAGAFCTRIAGYWRGSAGQAEGNCPPARRQRHTAPAADDPETPRRGCG